MQRLTVDLRDPDEERLRQAEAALSRVSRCDIARASTYEVSVERLARFEPVKFDQRIVATIEKAAKGSRPDQQADDLRRWPRRPDDRKDRADGHDLRSKYRWHQP